jgi:hypothetical protein
MWNKGVPLENKGVARLLVRENKCACPMYQVCIERESIPTVTVAARQSRSPPGSSERLRGAMSECFIKCPIIISLDGLQYVSVYPSHATRLIGSYVQYKLIDDSVKVKDVLMLKCPTEATPELSHLFDYQLMVLNSI